MLFASSTHSAVAIRKLSGYPAADFVENRMRSYDSIIYPDDQAVVNAIAQGDGIKDIIIEGDVDTFLASQQERIDDWNRVLDERFPDLD